MLLATATNPNQFNTLSGIMITLGVVIVAVLMTVSARRRITRRQANRPSPREMMEQIRRYADHGHSEDVDAAGARYLDETQHLMAQLDNKAERLAQLIADADDRIARLENVLATGEVTARAASQPLVQSIRPPTPTVAYSEASQTNDPVPQSMPATLPVDPLTRAVYDLADDGRRPIDIARDLDEQIGKIELILALRGGDSKVKTSKGQNVKT